jgi:hypothetical protein
MRKNAWRKEKMLIDQDYRDNQKAAQKKWQEHSPNYWQSYRATHPEYTQRNREAARIRKQKRALKRSGAIKPPDLAKSDASQKFAKSDAFHPEHSIKSGTYSLIPEGSPKFAKSDALIVKIVLVA